jgi:hypothetical protein
MEAATPVPPPQARAGAGAGVAAALLGELVPEQFEGLPENAASYAATKSMIS